MKYVIKNGHDVDFRSLPYNFRVSGLILDKDYFTVSLTCQVLQVPPNFRNMLVDWQWISIPSREQCGQCFQDMLRVL